MARVIAQGDMRPFKGRSAALDEITQASSPTATASTAAPISSWTRPARPLRASLSNSERRCRHDLLRNPARPLPPLEARASTARSPRSRSTSPRTSRIAPGYKLKLNSYDLGVDIELADALNRIRFEHPEVKSVIVTSGKSRMFCSGANIYMLGHSSHACQGQLLQVHQRDAQRHRGRERALRPQVHRRAERHHRRRRLRARAGLRRDRDDRRPLVDREPAGGAAARRAARHRRPDPIGRQEKSPARPRRRVLHHRRRRARRPREAVEAGRP